MNKINYQIQKMAFWNKLFGKEEKKESGKTEEQENKYNLPWIEADQNPWKVSLLDLRPISLRMLSSSKDQQMAENAVSYGQEDGLVFLEQSVKSDKSFETNFSFPADDKLERGVLFIPSEMEHKWAIYYHENKILFIRSWLREVHVVAETLQENKQLIITKIHGEFTEGESPEFTEAVLKFLVYSHVLSEVVPAPIPEDLQENTDAAGLWAFSTYGNMAHFAHFEPDINHQTQNILRSHSLLHIAIARGEMDKIKEELENGANINALANDGLSTLQWAMTTDLPILEFLLKAGASPNVESFEGATPIMTAVQSDKMEHLQLLIEHGAEVNKQDNRGFTALHRAAEMGRIEMVKELLEKGADKNLEAEEGHTALSLAAMGENSEDIEQILE